MSQCVCYKLFIVVAVGSTLGEETVKVNSLKDIVMVGGSLPPRHETTTSRPR